MIVLDASVVVELLLNGQLAGSLTQELSAHDDEFIAPHLLDVEVLSAVRRLAASQRSDAHRNEQFLARLAELPIERYPHTPFLSRIWELRQNFTAHDAAYIALAEAAGATLYTSDEKLSTGHRARVRLFRN